MENLSKDKVGLLKFPVATLTVAKWNYFRTNSLNKFTVYKAEWLYELDPLASPFPLPISLKISFLPLGKVSTSWIFIASAQCRWETFLSHPCLSAVPKRISSQGVSGSLLESTKLTYLFVFVSWGIQTNKMECSCWILRSLAGESQFLSLVFQSD